MHPKRKGLSLEVFFQSCLSPCIKNRQNDKRKQLGNWSHVRLNAVFTSDQLGSN